MISIRKTLAASALAAVLGVVAAAPLSAQTQYSGKVRYVLAPDYRPCAFLRLDSSSLFFALPVASPFFAERYAALLVAATGNYNVLIKTAGTSPECSNLGVAETIYITLF